jgi:hypothetical protein
MKMDNKQSNPYPNYYVGEHLIWATPLDHGTFPAGFHVKCLICGKIMLNHNVLKEECENLKD